MRIRNRRRRPTSVVRVVPGRYQNARKVSSCASVFRRTDRPARNGNAVVFDTGIVLSPTTRTVRRVVRDSVHGGPQNRANVRIRRVTRPPAVITATCRPRGDNTPRTSFAFYRRRRDQRPIERASLTWNQIIPIGGVAPRSARRRSWFYTWLLNAQFVFGKADLTGDVTFFGTHSFGPGFKFNTICVP